MVELLPSKQVVAGSNPVSRSNSLSHLDSRNCRHLGVGYLCSNTNPTGRFVLSGTFQRAIPGALTPDSIVR